MPFPAKPVSDPHPFLFGVQAARADMAEAGVAQELRDMLTAKAVRVIDLFKQWDEDGNGAVSKKEFRKAMPLLGLDVPRAEIDQLFDEWDPDKSGVLTFDELNKKLRRGSAVALDASLQAGAAGSIETESTTKIAVRKGPTKRGSSLGNIDMSASSGKSVAGQLRDILSKNAVRVIDLFREWDEDGDGTVSKKEFRKAMPLLGLDVPRAEIDKLFDEWDPVSAPPSLLPSPLQHDPCLRVPCGPGQGRLALDRRAEQGAEARQRGPAEQGAAGRRPGAHRDGQGHQDRGAQGREQARLVAGHH